MTSPQGAIINQQRALSPSKRGFHDDVRHVLIVMKRQINLCQLSREVGIVTREHLAKAFNPGFFQLLVTLCMGMAENVYVKWFFRQSLCFFIKLSACNGVDAPTLIESSAPTLLTVAAI